MSVAIAELFVSVNQDLLRPKGDPAQNGLFEDVMRESYLQEEIAFQRGKLIPQNLEQVKCNSLLDGAIDLMPEQLMDKNSNDLKEITFFVLEKENVKNTNGYIRINPDFVEQEDVKNKNAGINVNSDFVEQEDVNNKNEGIIVNLDVVEQQDVKNKNQCINVNFNLVEQEDVKNKNACINVNPDLLEREDINNKNDSVKSNIDLVKIRYNDVQIIFPFLKDVAKPFIIEQQKKRTDDITKDPKASLMLFTAGQETNQGFSQKQIDLNDSIVKNPSFSIEVPLELRDVTEEVDTKISTPYFAANFMVQEKNNADLGSIKKENSILRNVEQVVFQANGAELFDVNNKSEHGKSSSYIENEEKAFLRENTPVETLKVVDQKNINQQLNVDEHKLHESIEEKPQAGGAKLINQLSEHNPELQSKIDTQPKIDDQLKTDAQPKIDAQPGFSALTSSDNSKEFVLTNQKNGLSQINEQSKSMIGLKIGNLTHQDGVQSLKISILPHELGTIKLDLKTNAETNLTEAHFTFSHQDGFDLFQGNRQDLLALLGKSGLDIQPDKVSFDLLSFSDSSSQFAHEHPKDTQDLNQKTHFFRGEDNEPSLEDIKQTQSNLTTTSLLNLMV